MSKKRFKRKIIAVVLAAGKGKRMRSNLPKVLHEVSGLPMVLAVIRNLRAAGIDKIIVVTGQGREKLEKKLPKDVVCVYQAKQLGTGHAVDCARSYFKGFRGDILIACGDMPLVETRTYSRLISVHQKNNNVCTLVTGLSKEPAGYGRIIRGAGGAISRIGEDKDVSSKDKKISEVNSGVYCFRAKSLFNAISSIGRVNRQKEYYLTDSVAILVGKGLSVGSLTIRDEEQLLGVNSRNDLSLVNRIMNRRVIENHLKRGVTIISPETTFIDLRARIGRDTVINPFTVIAGEVVIGRDCVVGPFSHLRTKTVLKDRAEIGNFVEVKKSSIGRHTKAKHLSYLGDTIIGKKVNIGAGTITANYDGKNKYQTVIKDRVFIGSNTTLVAPLSVGKGALTGAGSVVLRNRNVPPNAVVVGAPARVLRKKK